MENPWWPLSGVRVVTPRLELRYVDEELSIELVELADQGIHDPASMPFTIPWTDDPTPQRQWDSMRHYSRLRAEATPRSWAIELAAIVAGEVVGATTLRAADFPRRRVVGTGSWLGLAHHGRGTGTEMRAATLHLGFAGFGALRAETEAFADNAASLGVTRKLGYEPNGDQVAVRRGARDRLVQFKLERAAWEAQRRDDVELFGVDAAREFLAIA